MRIVCLTFLVVLAVSRVNLQQMFGRALYFGNAFDHRDNLDALGKHFYWGDGGNTIWGHGDIIWDHGSNTNVEGGNNIDWGSGDRFDRKVAKEIKNVAVNRMQMNMEGDHDRVSNAIRCAECITSTFYSYQTACQQDCQETVVRIYMEDIYGPVDYDQTKICKKCLRKAATHYDYECTYQCTIRDLDRVLYFLISQ